MNIFYEFFGEGRDLNVLQMSLRAFVIFFIAWLLLRISGRRSFGLRTPLDNIITILLGAILGRAVVGISPVVPVVAACFVFVILHRLMARGMVNNKKLGHFIEGGKILLFENGKFISENMKRALVSREDIIQGLRKSHFTEQFDEVEKVFMERNGEITFVKTQE